MYHLTNINQSYPNRQSQATKASTCQPTELKSHQDSFFPSTINILALTLIQQAKGTGIIPEGRTDW